MFKNYPEKNVNPLFPLLKAQNPKELKTLKHALAYETGKTTWDIGSLVDHELELKKELKSNVLFTSSYILAKYLMGSEEINLQFQSKANEMMYKVKAKVTEMHEMLEVLEAEYKLDFHSQEQSKYDKYKQDTITEKADKALRIKHEVTHEPPEALEWIKPYIEYEMREDLDIEALIDKEIGLKHEFTLAIRSDLQDAMNNITQEMHYAVTKDECMETVNDFESSYRDIFVKYQAGSEEITSYFQTRAQELKNEVKEELSGTLSGISLGPQ